MRGYQLGRIASLSLGQVKAVTVEDWLRILPLANGSKAKVRGLWGGIQACHASRTAFGQSHRQCSAGKKTGCRA